MDERHSLPHQCYYARQCASNDETECSVTQWPELQSCCFPWSNGCQYQAGGENHLPRRRAMSESPCSTCCRRATNCCSNSTDGSGSCQFSLCRAKSSLPIFSTIHRANVNKCKTTERKYLSLTGSAADANVYLALWAGGSCVPCHGYTESSDSFFIGCCMDRTQMNEPECDIGDRSWVLSQNGVIKETLPSDGKHTNMASGHCHDDPVTGTTAGSVCPRLTSVLGIADGVGSWSEFGFEPWKFPQELLHHAALFAHFACQRRSGAILEPKASADALKGALSCHSYSNSRDIMIQGDARHLSVISTEASMDMEGGLNNASLRSFCDGATGKCAVPDAQKSAKISNCNKSESHHFLEMLNSSECHNQTAKHIMERAFEKTVSYGSSTCLIVYLDSERKVLEVANIGDSAVMVLRSQQRGRPLTVVRRTRAHQHYFNCPYQLARVPELDLILEWIRLQHLVELLEDKPVENGEQRTWETAEQSTVCNDQRDKEESLLTIATGKKFPTASLEHSHIKASVERSATLMFEPDAYVANAVLTDISHCSDNGKGMSKGNPQSRLLLYRTTEGESTFRQGSATRPVARKTLVDYKNEVYRQLAHPGRHWRYYPADGYNRRNLSSDVSLADDPSSIESSVSGGIDQDECRSFVKQSGWSNGTREETHMLPQITEASELIECHSPVSAQNTPTSEHPLQAKAFKSSTENLNETWRSAAENKKQIIEFRNTCKQIGFVGKGSQGVSQLKMLLHDHGDMCRDTAADCQVYSIPVKEGDLIVVGTDGIFDNLHDYEICGALANTTSPIVAQQWMSESMKPYGDIFPVVQASKVSADRENSLSGQQTPTCGDPSHCCTCANIHTSFKIDGKASPVMPTCPEMLAAKLTHMAYLRSLETTARTPFTREARKNDIPFGGGKKDDATAVVAWVVDAGLSNSRSLLY